MMLSTKLFTRGSISFFVVLVSSSKSGFDLRKLTDVCLWCGRCVASMAISLG